ncbi:substrate-binding periplasmic protein [Alkalimarinus sediminis]|uniref:Solute-binding protein family 3/N-terminal domain-containing protein n=1 Tax=Alkalimarinus sediminis TaxID=1632866 RepID=A0A9E8KNL3_9ALTE|nr:hypothetical protein [Alkalimarinus sediminis]UZW74468.1 hypothetical protein NNL22_15800 [Alkalimarinus sediminis]
MIKIITILSSLILYASASQAFGEEVNYLIVEDLSVPFQVTEQGESKGGIITDIVDEVFKDSSYTVKHHVLPLNRLYKMIESRELQNWIAYDAKAWNSLSQWGEFVPEPLFSVNHTYLTCKENPPLHFESADDINNQKIATIRGFINPELSELEKNDKLSLVPVDEYLQGINLAALSRVDGFVEMELRIRFNMQRESINEPCLKFVDMSQIIPAYSIYFSTDKHNNTGLNQFVNNRIKTLKGTGKIDQMMGQYTQTKLGAVATNNSQP